MLGIGHQVIVNVLLDVHRRVVCIVPLPVRIR